jgi:hypothetical protein
MGASITTKNMHDIAKCAVGRKLSEIAYLVLKGERPYEDRG